MICTHYHYSKSFQAFTRLFWRQLIKNTIGQFFAQKHLGLSLTHTHIHTKRLSQMQMWILSLI